MTEMVLSPLLATYTRLPSALATTSTGWDPTAMVARTENAVDLRPAAATRRSAGLPVPERAVDLADVSRCVAAASVAVTRLAAGFAGVSRRGAVTRFTRAVDAEGLPAVAVAEVCGDRPVPSSACATPDPTDSAAPRPRVSAPALNHEYGSRRLLTRNPPVSFDRTSVCQRHTKSLISVVTAITCELHEFANLLDRGASAIRALASA